MEVRIVSDEGETLGTEGLKEADFKSGSRGFRGNLKMAANGCRYQVNITMVEIGSKPKPE